MVRSRRSSKRPSLSPFIIQKIPVRLLRRTLVHAQVEIAGCDQAVVPQDLLNMPNWTPIEEKRRRHCMPQHVRGHGLGKANRSTESTKPRKRDLLLKPFAMSTYDK